MAQGLRYIVRLRCGCSPSCSLPLLLLENSTYPLFAPLSQFPTSSSTSSEHIPGERTTAPSCLLSLRARHWENRLCLRHSPSHSIIPPPASLPHVYSALRPFQRPSASISHSLVPAPASPPLAIRRKYFLANSCIFSLLSISF